MHPIAAISVDRLGGRLAIVRLGRLACEGDGFARRKLSSRIRRRQVPLGMDYRVLGPLAVRGHNATALPAAKQQSLLAMLLVDANRPVSVDTLMDGLWGSNPPGGGVRALRFHVSKLRDALTPQRDTGEGGPLETTPHGYLLHVGADELDALRFEDLAQAGSRDLASGQTVRARDQLAAALELWRGSAYQDFRYEPFAQSEIIRLEEERLLCLEDRIQADLELGDHRGVLGELRDLTTRYPLRERFWGQLMVALYRTDQQAEALSAFQSASRVLGDELGIEPNESLRKLEDQILLHELPFEPSRPAWARHNLPARIQSLVGRAAEIEELEMLLGSNRLVTVTGFGGVGKSTLALEVGRRAGGAFSQGAWLAELAPLTEDREVADQVGAALGHPPLVGSDPVDALVARLVDHDALLILDNCEHLGPGVADFVETLLHGCQGLRVMATSRVPLGIIGEQVYVVPPLQVPAGSSAMEVLQSESVALFVDRANLHGAVGSSPGEIAAIAEICRRLDGVPLAIELAAAQVRLVSAPQLLERLDADLGTLGSVTSMPERHRSIRTVIDWSHSLLEPPQQVLFRRLAAFADAPTMRAIDQVCGGGGLDGEEMLGLVGDLISASLLDVRDTDPRRYGMLALVRAYALDQLRASGEEAKIRQRHCAYFASAYSDLPAFDSPEFAGRLAGLSRNAPEVRAALAWAVESGDAGSAVALAANLDVHANYAAPNPHVIPMFDRVLAISRGTISAERARILGATVGVHIESGRLADAESTLEELRQAAASSADLFVYSTAAWAEADYLMAVGATVEACQAVGRAAEHLEAHGDPEAAQLRGWLASECVRAGDVRGTEFHLEKMEGAVASMGLPMISIWVTSIRGEEALYRGDLQVSYLLLSQALARLRKLDRHGVAGVALGPLVEVCLATDRIDEAKQHALYFLENARMSGFPSDVCIATLGLARSLLREGKVGAAIEAAAEAIEITTVWNDAGERSHLLFVIAQIARARGQVADSVVFHAAAATRLDLVGEILPKPLERELRAALDHARSVLGDRSFDHAWEIGQSEPWEALTQRARRLFSQWPNDTDRAGDVPAGL